MLLKVNLRSCLNRELAKLDDKQLLHDIENGFKQTLKEYEMNNGPLISGGENNPVHYFDASKGGRAYIIRATDTSGKVKAFTKQEIANINNYCKRFNRNLYSVIARVDEDRRIHYWINNGFDIAQSPNLYHGFTYRSKLPVSAKSRVIREEIVESRKYRTFDPKRKKSMQAWAEKNYRGWVDGLDDYERYVVEEYGFSSGDFDFARDRKGGWNTRLRFGMPISKDDMETVRDLEKVLAKANAKENFTAYRGIAVRPEDFEKAISKGKLYKDKGFSSFSLDKEWAIDFTGNVERTGIKEGVMVELQVPKNANAGYISWATEDEPDLLGLMDEREVVVTRNSVMKIKSKRREVIAGKKVTVYKAELVGYEKDGKEFLYNE